MFSLGYNNYEFCLRQGLSKKHFNCNKLVLMSNADRVEDEEEGIVKGDLTVPFTYFSG